MNLPPTNEIDKVAPAKRNRKALAASWKCVKNKRKREKGESYFGRRKINGKWKYCKSKEQRAVKKRCNCKKNYFRCDEFSDVQRLTFHDDFWNMKWVEKRNYINVLVSSAVKQTKNKGIKRKKTYQYHLKCKDGALQRVCKTMFLNTFDIGEFTVRKWLCDKAREYELGISTLSPNTVRKSPTYHRSRSKKRVSQKIEDVKQFLNRLPKLESHYCRSSSSKLYLETIYNSKAEVYRVYESISANPASMKTFIDVMTQLNIDVSKPKKDQCDICVGFTNGNVPENKYNKHTELKNKARNSKENDKQSAKFIFTMDVQKVLMAPKMQASALYFKSKMVIHNYSIYDLKTHAGYCYLWNESEGGLSSSEFTSMLVDFINQNVKCEIGDEIIFYSDGCGYQNRNVHLSNGLLQLAHEKRISIVHNYLEKGHTQMEVDSMLSNIEKK